MVIFLVRLYGAMGAPAAFQRTRHPVTKKPRILLVRPDHLGDLVLTTPVLRALKAQAPDAHITMLVGPWASEVVARHPDVDQVLTCPFPNLGRVPQHVLEPYLVLLRVAQQLRQSHYDLAINLRPDYWWGAALLYLTHIPHRIGYASEAGTGTPFLTQVLPTALQEHVTVSNLRLVSAGLQTLGYSPLAEPYTAQEYPLSFIPTQDEHRWATERLSAEGIAPATAVVVIHPGTGAGVKLWRPEAWATCITTLMQFSTTSTPLRILLTGSPGERSLLEEITKGTNSPITVVTDATIGQLAALLQRAQLVLGVDSGPLHLAVAQRTRTIRIFGPTHPCSYGPWGEQDQHTMILSTHRCATCPSIPCFRLDVRPEELASHPCVRLVPEQPVLLAIARHLPHLLPSHRSSIEQVIASEQANSHALMRERKSPESRS
ncbi:MAG: glycosyltransferase family 9 protein [Ktedonobacteraceae bacterium]